MINVTVSFDDHHSASARELMVIAQRDWPAKLVTRVEKQNVETRHPDHRCEFCRGSNGQL
jgi:hypothetical protein